MDLAAVPECKQHEGQLKWEANQGLSACDAQGQLWGLIHAQINIGGEDQQKQDDGCPTCNPARAWEPQKDTHKYFPSTSDVDQIQMEGQPRGHNVQEEFRVSKVPNTDCDIQRTHGPNGHNSNPLHGEAGCFVVCGSSDPTHFVFGRLSLSHQGTKTLSFIDWPSA